MPLDIKAELAKIDEMYKADASQANFNALILGPFGSGKTRILSTARKPVLIHSFDPGGSKTLRKEIEEGTIYADTRFEQEDSKNPRAYAAWEKEFDRIRREGILASVGTYCIDSFTTWLEALKNEVCRRKQRPDGIPQIQDWMMMGNLLKDAVKLAASHGCDFILTGHITLEKDDMYGKGVAKIVGPPSLQDYIPILFDEIYVMQSEETSKGNQYFLYTQNNGKYMARTRIGRDKFAAKEEPDIKKLLAKAGLPTEDKKI